MLTVSHCIARKATLTLTYNRAASVAFHPTLINSMNELSRALPLDRLGHPFGESHSMIAFRNEGSTIAIARHITIDRFKDFVMVDAQGDGHSRLV